MSFISPDDVYDSKLAKHIPDVLLNNQGRIAAIAVEQGYDGPLSHESESTDFYNDLFKAHSVFIKAE